MSTPANMAKVVSHLACEYLLSLPPPQQRPFLFLIVPVVPATILHTSLALPNILVHRGKAIRPLYFHPLSHRLTADNGRSPFPIPNELQ